MELKELAQAMTEATAEVKSLKEKHDAELKATGAALAETKTALAAAEEKNAELVARFEKLDAKFADMEVEAKRFKSGQRQEIKSIGQQFVESDVYAGVKSANRGNGIPFECKDITNLAASAGALAPVVTDPEVYRSIGGMRQTRIRDLIPTVPTSSDSVRIMRMKTVTNSAAPQGTVAGVGGGELAAKAKSDYVWEEVTVPVSTVAHYVIASRQALSDSNMLRSLIDTELNYGLQLESDDQLLLGDGTGQNLTGILNDAAINNVGQLASGTLAANVPAAMIDHIRAAITECQKSEYYNINGIVMNPVDFSTLETAKATDGHYILMPFAATNTTTTQIWRVPVVISNAMPVGQFLLGDWTIGAKIYAREGVSVRVSESHGELFVKNGVVVLAEERYCLGVSRPKAFTKGDFTVAP